MGKYKYLLITLGVCFAVAIALLGYIFIGCKYSGVEFSPDDFTVRHFSYIYEPMTNSVISGRSFADQDDYNYGFYSHMLPELVANNYIRPVFKKKKTWHLVEDNGVYYAGSSSDSDAQLLVNFLALYNENHENTWTAWNSEHPKLAKVLWPMVAEMARDKTYLTIGDVLTFALDSEQTDPKLFKADLREEVAKAYLKLGRIDFKKDDLESAEYRVKKSIKFQTNDDAKSLLNSIQSADQQS